MYNETMEKERSQNAASKEKMIVEGKEWGWCVDDKEEKVEVKTKEKAVKGTRGESGLEKEEEEEVGTLDERWRHNGDVGEE